MTPDPIYRIELVVKIGGGLLASPQDLTDALEVISTLAARTRTLIVPGGGPFADAVRHVHPDIGLGDNEAHWMAILGMDQYAHLLASKLANATLVTTPDELPRILAQSRIPVLAPYQWLRRTDPLPHAWDVTSDSIAAWIAGQLGAERLLLVKPPAATEPLVDGYFSRVVPPGVTPVVARAGEQLRTALANG